MAMTALLASLLAMASPCAMGFAIIIFDALRGTEGSIVLYVSPPTCVTYDLSDRQIETSAEYIGEMHELTILANVTPVCQS